MRQAAVALATLFFFGCQTVQVTSVEVLGAAPAARVALAEPSLDLWVEGAGEVSPAETAAALAASRRALSASLEGRGFAPAEGADYLLVVQEQALARTEGRRSQQVGATVGIVLLIAAVVVVIVVLASQGHSHSGKAAPAGPVAGRAAGGGAVGRAVGGAPAPAFHHHPPGGGFGWNVGILWFPGPVGPAAPPPYLPPLAPPPLEARLAERGFWAGDEVELVVELRDARTGQAAWTRRAADEIDPRDPVAVRELLDRIVGREPWARGGPPPPAVQPPAPPSPPPGVPPPAPPAAPPPPTPVPAAAKPGVALR